MNIIEPKLLRTVCKDVCDTFIISRLGFWDDWLILSVADWSKSHREMRKVSKQTRMISYNKTVQKCGVFDWLNMIV